MALSFFFTHEGCFRLKCTGQRRDACFYFESRFTQLPVLFRLFIDFKITIKCVLSTSTGMLFR